MLPLDLENLILEFVKICEGCNIAFILEERSWMGYVCTSFREFDDCVRLDSLCVDCHNERVAYSSQGEALCEDCCSLYIR